MIVPYLWVGLAFDNVWRFWQAEMRAEVTATYQHRSFRRSWILRVADFSPEADTDTSKDRVSSVNLALRKVAGGH